MKRRVAITGVGAITPLGVGADALIDRWTAGETGIRDGVARCDDFEPRAVLSKKEVRRSDRFTQLALAASCEAVEQAGWPDALPVEGDRVGCVLGTGIGGLTTIEQQHDVLRERGGKALSPLGVPSMMANACAAAVAMRHGLRGPSYGVVSACAAGAHAIGVALRMIQCGDADAVLTGAAESAMTEMAIGEGAGVLALEALEIAEARGATILGELIGYGASSDAFHLTAPDPDGTGPARAIRRALDDAGVGPAEVGYVNAHGTSTPLNDRAETAAIKLAFGQHAERVPVSAPKSAIGHLLGAGGAVEAVATVLAVNRRTIPPTLGWEEPEEGLDLDYVPGEARELPGGHDAERVVAISNSFGFGGHNAVLAFAG